MNIKKSEKSVKDFLSGFFSSKKNTAIFAAAVAVVIAAVCVIAFTVGHKRDENKVDEYLNQRFETYGEMNIIADAAEVDGKINTLAGIKEAARLGADTVTLDLCFNSSDVPVICENYDDITKDTLTLEEVLKLLGDEKYSALKINLRIKQLSSLDKFNELLAKYDMSGRVIISGIDKNRYSLISGEDTAAGLFFDFNPPHNPKKAKKEIKMVLKLLHIDYKCEDIEKFYNLKSKGLIISNHLSGIDPLILIAISDKPITFISKSENLKVPFLRTVAKALEVFPVDRQNVMNQVSHIKNIVNYLKNPEKPDVIVYIEGTRNRFPENPCLDFHTGTLKLAQMANVPLVTLATYGTFRVFDKKSFLKRVPVNCKFIKVRSAEEVKGKKTDDFAVELKKEIDDTVDSLRKVDLEYFKNLKISDKKRELETLCDARVKS